MSDQTQLETVYQQIKDHLQNGIVPFWRERAEDVEYGGYYTNFAEDGSQPDQGKVVYGQSFAIYALFEYALSTSDPRGIEYASRTFNLLQKYCADTRWGAYYENLERDWPPSGRAMLECEQRLSQILTKTVEKG